MIRDLVHGVLLATTSAVARVLSRRRRRPGPVRSLWTGSPILNMAINAQAERRLGVESDSLVLHTYFITDAFTYDLSRWMRVPLVRTVLPYAVLVWASRKYDRFHFYCDRGVLTPRGPYRMVTGELDLLRGLGRELVFWTYGADVRTTARTKALGEPNCCTNCPSPGRLCICDDVAGAAQYARVRAAASAVFSMGDMIEYTPGSDPGVYFWPVDLEADGGSRYAPSYPEVASSGPLRVVHAPNHRHFKGTDHLIAAVERLRASGVSIELVMVERVPNVEALRLYRTADVVFDQCLIGYHGYLAQEAMALGKPVMCFIRRPESYLLAPGECPIINTPRDAVESTLRELAGDRARLRRLGEAGRRYIERYHTPERFAARLAEAYRRHGVTGPADAGGSAHAGGSRSAS
ncbi:MAG: glycosyltransferase [Phycisphaerales bacterium]|nr:glycosyltransferase [Phycisphaerales bacterium]